MTGSLALSFTWAVPLSSEHAALVFDRSLGNGFLKRLDGVLGAEWASAENFLTSYAESPHRFLLTSPDGALEIGVGATAIPCQLIVTWHPSYHSMTLIVATTISSPGKASAAADVDLAVAVLQGLQGRPSAADGQGGYRVHGRYRGERHPSIRDSVTKAFDDLTRECDLTESLSRKGWCVEFRNHDGYPPGRIVDTDPRPFYGLATSDEGWRFVPTEVARDALGQSWGTRTFVAVYAMACGLVCLNSKGAEYVARQRELAVEHFGATEPYFDIDSGVAGLDHGMLFILERVLIRMALADQWLHRAQQGRGEPVDSSRSATRERLLRGSLDDILEMLNSVLPPEIDSLERRLVTSMGVDRIIRQLDRQAEAMDEETRYSYESVVSARVTRLTVVTVVLTIVTIILGVLQVIVTL